MEQDLTQLTVSYIVVVAAVVVSSLLLSIIISIVLVIGVISYIWLYSIITRCAGGCKMCWYA